MKDTITKCSKEDVMKCVNAIYKSIDDIKAENVPEEAFFSALCYLVNEYTSKTGWIPMQVLQGDVQ